MGRRAIGLTLLGIGAFLLVGALMVLVLLAPTLVRLPLDQEGSSTVVDDNATYLDKQTLTEVEGPVTVNVVVQGDAGADEASDDVAVWNSGTTVTTPDGKVIIDPSQSVTCLNRTTAHAVACDASSVNGKPAAVEGLTVTFPLGTEKKDYQVWNGNVGKAFPAEYAGQEQVDGVTVYRFEQTIPETVIDEMEVPGALAGVPDEPSVTAEVVYSNSRTMLVEPTSGKYVSVSEAPKTVLRGPDGETGATVLSATLAPTEDSVQAAADSAASTKGDIDTVTKALPLGLGGLGLVLIAGGAVLVTRPGRRQDGPSVGQHAADQPEALPAAY